MAPTAPGTYVSHTRPAAHPGTYTGVPATRPGSYVSGVTAPGCPGRYTQAAAHLARRTPATTTATRVGIA